jgi:hypothetical protein
VMLVSMTVADIELEACAKALVDCLCPGNMRPNEAVATVAGSFSANCPRCEEILDARAVLWSALYAGTHRPDGKAKPTAQLNKNQVETAGIYGGAEKMFACPKCKIPLEAIDLRLTPSESQWTRLLGDRAFSNLSAIREHSAKVLHLSLENRR